MTFCNVLVLNRTAPTSKEGVCKNTEAKTVVEGRSRLEEPGVVREEEVALRKKEEGCCWRREPEGEPALLAAC